MPKLTKDHNFVKIMKPENLKIKKCPSSDHRKTFCITSSQSNHEPGKSCGGQSLNQHGQQLQQKRSNQNSKTTYTSAYHRKQVYKISDESDESCKRNCGDKISELQSVCQHGR